MKRIRKWRTRGGHSMLQCFSNSWQLIDLKAKVFTNDSASTTWLGNPFAIPYLHHSFVRKCLLTSRIWSQLNYTCASKGELTECVLEIWLDNLALTSSIGKTAQVWYEIWRCPWLIFFFCRCLLEQDKLTKKICIITGNLITNVHIVKAKPGWLAKFQMQCYRKELQKAPNVVSNKLT